MLEGSTDGILIVKRLLGESIERADRYDEKQQIQLRGEASRTRKALLLIYQMHSHMSTVSDLFGILTFIDYSDRCRARSNSSEGVS
jgi:hypothetical protein